VPDSRRADAAEPAPQAGRPLPTALLVTAIVLVALNLRPSMAGFGPLLAQMQQELHATAGVMGLLSTVPLLLWGLLAPVAPWLTRRLSSETVVLACLLVLALGAALRIGPTMGVIMGGTVLVGAAIAVMNVLLPGLVKRDFPHQTGLMTGVYTMALVGGASLASGLAVPLRDALGGAWRHSMAAWAVFALVGAVAWLPTLLATRHHQVPPPAPRAPLWKSPLAWQLTMFMGLQSLVFFAWLTWLPRLLQDHGMTTAESGWLLAVGNLVQIPVTLVLPIVAGRMARQRALAVATAAVTAAGLFGLLVAPMAAPVAWMLLLGIGGGASISLALMLIVLRAHDNRQVAQLSAMAQGVGYLLSALGPLLFGWLYDASGRWEPSLILLLICTLGMGVFGMGAGRAAYVADSTP
jgi:CP family cyanate transporter-like MFS transporter